MADDVPKLQLAGAPVLDVNPDVPAIVEWKLRSIPWWNEMGIHTFTIGQPAGQLPAGANAANITLGKRYILACIKCPDTKTLLQPLANGPAILLYINNHLLGGRDEQSVIQDMLENMLLLGHLFDVSCSWC